MDRKHILEFGALALGVVAVALVLKNADNASLVVPDTTNQTSGGTGANPLQGTPGYIYYNYADRSPQQGETLVSPIQPNQVGAPTPTTPCGCSGSGSSQLFATESQLAAYYEQQGSSLIQKYTDDVTSALPNWFSNYLNNANAGTLGASPSQLTF